MPAENTEDVVSTSAYSGDLGTITLADRMLGGGKVSWHKDGALKARTMGNSFAATDTSASRFSIDAEGNEALSVKKHTNNLAENSQSKDDAKALAKSLATITITGNSAAYGGGLAANGGIDIGKDDELMDIPVEKVWSDKENQDGIRPESVTVKLMLNGNEVDSLKLSADKVRPDSITFNLLAMARRLTARL